MARWRAYWDRPTGTLEFHGEALECDYGHGPYASRPDFWRVVALCQAAGLRLRQAEEVVAGHCVVDGRYRSNFRYWLVTPDNNVIGPAADRNHHGPLTAAERDALAGPNGLAVLWTGEALFKVVV